MYCPFHCLVSRLDVLIVLSLFSCISYLVLFLNKCVPVCPTLDAIAYWTYLVSGTTLPVIPRDFQGTIARAACRTVMAYSCIFVDQDLYCIPKIRTADSIVRVKLQPKNSMVRP